MTLPAGSVRRFWAATVETAQSDKARLHAARGKSRCVSCCIAVLLNGVGIRVSMYPLFKSRTRTELASLLGRLLSNSNRDTHEFLVAIKGCDGHCAGATHDALRTAGSLHQETHDEAQVAFSRSSRSCSRDGAAKCWGSDGHPVYRRRSRMGIGRPL